MLGPESGTLASQNYPGTYPSNAWCKWKLRVSEGRTLRLLFGDLDIENSPGCGNGSLVIAEKNGKLSLGKVDESQETSTSLSEERRRLSLLGMADAVPPSLSRRTRARPPSCLEGTEKVDSPKEIFHFVLCRGYY